ncbi:hypothetical protein B0A49_05986 [Cryomyces minteri]|uniref:Uncharacterized protein n=1 Tax=Cryomyces minteri TaxID=331657 RepID=A0A4U0XA08_9PEZI|nr:hypothetical protein B0A49_05986 [Cryomyces minteri]
MSTSLMANSQNTDAERANFLNTYMMLYSQQTDLRRRLSSTSSPTSSPEAVSLSSSPEARSPTFHHATISPVSRSTSGMPRRHRHSVSSVPEKPYEEEDPLDTSCDEDRLHEITQQIKATLTDLLNCAWVRHDDKFRAWVQSRLMDAEKELKQQKRRRLSVDRGVTDYLNESFAEDIGRRISM